MPHSNSIHAVAFLKCTRSNGRELVRVPLVAPERDVHLLVWVGICVRWKDGVSDPTIDHQPSTNHASRTQLTWYLPRSEGLLAGVAKGFTPASVRWREKADDDYK